jgi:hypothetical protein
LVSSFLSILCISAVSICIAGLVLKYFIVFGVTVSVTMILNQFPYAVCVEM